MVINAQKMSNNAQKMLRIVLQILSINGLGIFQLRTTDGPEYFCGYDIYRFKEGTFFAVAAVK